MVEEREEGPLASARLNTQEEEREEGPTSIEVTNSPISIGEAPTNPQEETLREQNRGTAVLKQVREEESGTSANKQKRRRITSYLTKISKQEAKNENRINKAIIMVQSLQKQRPTKSMARAGTGELQLQSFKQIQSQVSHLQKQVAQIQNDIKRIKIAPSEAKTRSKNLSLTTLKRSSKRMNKIRKNNPSKRIKVKKGRRER
ncbi:MAG: hypothetical protein WBX01_11990 [Nitrososphaeraceae archaeon]